MRKHKFDIKSLDNLETFVAKIAMLLSEMEEICLEAGIPKVKYDYALKNLEKQSKDFQEALFNWLVYFYGNEYKNAKTMWDKMSSHGWKNLKVLLDVHNLPEQKLLYEKFKTLRTAWFSRPRPIKNNKIMLDSLKEVS